MRRLISTSLCAVVALVLGAAMAPGVSGRGREKPPEASGLVSFHIQLDNGYRFEFSGANLPGGDQARVSFTKDDQSVTYEHNNAAQITGRRVRARFPGLGQVHVRFRPAARSGRCAKGPVRGGFRGKIDVAAERAFAVVDARRARGEYRSLGCNLRALRAGWPWRGALGVELGPRATSREQLKVLSTCEASTNYEATSFHDVVEHNATTIERGERLTIYRYAYLKAGADTFHISPDLQSAAVFPTAPFSGRALYSSGQLSGDLTVWFLGLRSPVALTPATAAAGAGNGSPCLPG